MRPPRTPRRRDATASPRTVEAFNPGDPVEVLPDEPGLRGAYLEAVVVGPSTKPRGYTVEYDALLESEDSDRKLRETLPARNLRPRPPPLRAPASGDAPALHASVDALLDDAWWLGVALGGADGAGKVKVCFPETREVMDFDAADIRPHLEWANGEWCSPDSMEIPKTMPYTKGMQIEVSKYEGDSVIAWLPAVVTKTIWKNNLLVEYTVSKSDGIALSEEIVDVKHVRPCPPQASAIRFCINDEVEAFRGGGWWLGVITDVHPELKYTFKPAHLGVEVQLSQKLLRLRYDWVDGQWKQESQAAPVNLTAKKTCITCNLLIGDDQAITGEEFKKSSSSPCRCANQEDAPLRLGNLESICAANTFKAKFKQGAKVEVSSEDEGFRGAWFEATVLKSAGSKFVVEYAALKAEDETKPLTEAVEVRHIRPPPPHIPVVDGFKLLDEVDAFCNDAWWVGVVSKVISDQKYMVYFKPWREELEFEHGKLRLHSDWMGGRWMWAAPALEM